MVATTAGPAAGTVPRPVLARLAGQVARLTDLDPVELEAVTAEALAADRGVVEYGDYQTGGWWTVSLLNHSGDPHDTVIGDGRPRSTTVLDRMPATKAFLARLDLDLMYVRLARLSAPAYLWEHRDYAELRETGRHRLHIPLVTNPSAVLVTAGCQIHMAPGALWRLTPTVAHGVRNTTGPDRLHLICDVYTTGAYADLAAQPLLDDGDAAVLPELTGADRERLLDDAARLVGLGFTDQAEQHLLRVFFGFAAPEGTGYELVAELHARGGDSERAQHWRETADRMLARTTTGTGADR
ncbi:aspartyl/asparaginyl beta-hydroxylase domain-containing protein [Streptomyces sp. NPDC004031]